MMTARKSVLIGCITIGLFSCSETSKPTEKEGLEATDKAQNATESDSKQAIVDEKAPELISFDATSNFSISTKKRGINPNTGTENIDIYLNNELLNAPIKLSQELSMYKVKAGNSGVPKNAVFAYNTWFAGGGSIFYGVVKNGVLQIYQKYEDEGMTTEGNFSLYREIDPHVQTKNPDTYITYDSDTKNSKQLMIAFSDDGKALYAKYYGQGRHLKLKFIKKANDERNYYDYYDEIADGKVVGSYVLTHSGNWDYAEYTRKKDGKKFKFTINHDITIVDGAYRTSPSL